MISKPKLKRKKQRKSKWCSKKEHYFLILKDNLNSINRFKRKTKKINKNDKQKKQANFEKETKSIY